MANASASAKIRLFADDTNIFLYNRNLNTLVCDSNKTLHDISKWMVANRLSINIEKTNYTLFSPTREKPSSEDIKLLLNNAPINMSKCVKYLGVHIDEDLKWCDHIKYVYTSIMKYVGIFYKIRYKLPQSSLKNLYYATVHPLIQYGIELYANTNQTYLYDLSVLNNKILRILQFQPMTSNVTDLHNAYNTMSVENLHSYKILLLMYKYFHCRNELPQSFQNYFIVNSSIHTHDTRSQANAHLSLYSTMYGVRCLNYHGSKLWNKLPENVKKLTSINSFKRAASELFKD